jgi:hypothetical protein
LVTNQGGYHPKDIPRAYWQPEQELNRAILPSESTKRDDDKSNKKKQISENNWNLNTLHSQKPKFPFTLHVMTVFSSKTYFYIKLIQVLHKFSVLICFFDKR